MNHKKQTMKSYMSLIFSGLSVFLYFMKFSNSTNALINTNNGDVMCIEIKEINSKCKFCNQQELDCASMGIMDGVLSSPTLSLSNLVPNQTSIINLSRNELTYLNIDSHGIKVFQHIIYLLFFICFLKLFKPGRNYENIWICL